jgi:hypothetical protein
MRVAVVKIACWDSEVDELALPDRREHLALDRRAVRMRPALSELI